MIALPRRVAAEGVGTFTLTFAGCGAIIADGLSDGAVTHVGIALTFGLAIMAMVIAIGETSGAHINPAVTVGFLIAGRMKALDAAGYIIAQSIGGLAAAFALHAIYPDAATLGQTTPAGSAMQSFVLEIILTFFLMFVILCVATGSKEQGLMAGVAIGGTITLDVLFGGPVSGASMNPARSFGPAAVAGDMSQLWIYLTAPLIGAAIAVAVWMVTVQTPKR